MHFPDGISSRKDAVAQKHTKRGSRRHMLRPYMRTTVHTAFLRVRAKHGLLKQQTRAMVALWLYKEAEPISSDASCA